MFDITMKDSSASSLYTLKNKEKKKKNSYTHFDEWRCLTVYTMRPNILDIKQDK